ncbi:helix-turn-helix domain-containing protein [Candidatus Neomarinimicrobiota bacterium]
MREIALIGLTQSLFFIFLILSKKDKEQKDYFLSLFLFFVAAELLYRFLINTIPESENKWLALFDIFYWSTFGPITLLYIRFTIKKQDKVKWIDLVYTIPLVISLYGIKDFFFGSIKYNSFIGYFNNTVGLTKAALYFWEFCSPVVLIYCLYILWKHNKAIKYYFSDESKYNLGWLIILLSVFVFYLLLSYSVWILNGLFGLSIFFSSLDLLPYILTGYVFVIGFFGYKQGGVFSKELIVQKQRAQIKQSSKEDKYKKSGLSEDERKTLVGRLKFIMETEKPFIEYDLNILDLSKMLETSVNKLSQVINESFHKNFYNFVNYHRIEEVKKLLKDPENQKFTIISIAYDCGFNSKSSFYSFFKQNTGTTPKEYLEKNSISKSH